jgi:hypothetical protein
MAVLLAVRNREFTPRGARLLREHWLETPHYLLAAPMTEKQYDDASDQ